VGQPPGSGVAALVMLGQTADASDTTNTIPTKHVHEVGVFPRLAVLVPDEAMSGLGVASADR
jgi:hypothetical protein